MGEALEAAAVFDVVDADDVIEQLGGRVGERIGLGDQDRSSSRVAGIVSMTTSIRAAMGSP
jgi:hypothetical protein